MVAGRSIPKSRLKAIQSRWVAKAEICQIWQITCANSALTRVLLLYIWPVKEREAIMSPIENAQMQGHPLLCGEALWHSLPQDTLY